MRLRGAWLIIAVALAACGPTGKSSRHGGGGSSSAARPDTKAAGKVLNAYLGATFAGRHGSGWNYLTRADQRRTPRASYIAAQREQDALRAQIGALGKPRRSIRRIDQRGDKVVADVAMTSGLGTDVIRFVLRVDGGKWRIAYARSWSSSN